MYINLYNLAELEQLLNRTLQSPNFALNPDKNALYYCIVENVEIIKAVKGSYHRQLFVNNLQNFISEPPKPIIKWVEIKEGNACITYKAELLKPYSLPYAKIAEFLDREVQREVNKLSITPIEVRMFAADNISVLFQRLVEEKFTEISMDYHKDLEGQQANVDPFFLFLGGLYYTSELLADLLDLLQHPIFGIDVEEFTFFKLVNITKGMNK